ncbi:MAG: hypothetical protein DRP87_19910 [Spirochaetes bacterium]|nr:MAG: hypothetical protein DRP87_19910 [Spirochaetota bacterium]
MDAFHTQKIPSIGDFITAIQGLCLLKTDPSGVWYGKERVYFSRLFLSGQNNDLLDSLLEEERAGWGKAAYTLFSRLQGNLSLDVGRYIRSILVRGF